MVGTKCHGVSRSISEYVLRVEVETELRVNMDQGVVVGTGECTE